MNLRLLIALGDGLFYCTMYSDYGVSSLDQWPLSSFRELYIIGRFFAKMHALRNVDLHVIGNY